MTICMFEGREELGRFATLAAAMAYLPYLGEVILAEEDSDFEGCADAYLANGRVICIHPEGFSL